MGRGNWTLQNNDLDYELIYADIFANIDYDGSQNDIDFECFYAHEDLEETLKSVLPDSFLTVNESYSRDSVIFARNGLFDVILADNENTIAICLSTRYDSPNFASGKLTKLATKIFDGLFWGFDLFVRTGPWTSSMYIPSIFIESNLYKENDHKFYIKLRKYPMLEININELDRHDITINHLETDLVFDRKSLSIFDNSFNRNILYKIAQYVKGLK